MRRGKKKVEVYVSRHSPGVTGENILWNAGEEAIFRSRDETKPPVIVTILTGERVSHAEAPGVVCMEVHFPDGDHCVPAKQLTPVNGWPAWWPDVVLPQEDRR